MQVPIWTAFIFALGIGAVSGQNRPDTVSPTDTSGPPGAERVYFSAPDLAPPELIPPQTPTFSSAKCRDKLSGSVRLSLVVDANGHPRNVYFDHPLGNELDQIAPVVAEADHFKPGALHGQPIAVGRLVTIRLEACIDRSTDASGKTAAKIRLRSQPKQEFSGAPEPAEALFLHPVPAEEQAPIPLKGAHGVIAPKILLFKESEYSDYARRKGINGACALSLAVDAHGMPQNVQLIRSLEASLDEKAIEAAYGYRFKPAMKDGDPVPVAIDVEVSFHLQ